MVKIDYDPALITLAQNTVKFARALRNKVENSYGGAKQKYQLMLDKIPLCFLDDLYDDPAVNISKYTALLTTILSLFNREHAGFPVNFIKQEKKVWKANQLLQNFTKENFLLHVDLLRLSGWQRYTSEQEFEVNFDFPQVTHHTFDELIELTSSVHSLTKAISVKGNLRRAEVEEMDEDDIEDFETYAALIKGQLDECKVNYLRLDEPPAEYSSMVASGILPPWPGKGTAYQVACLPHYKSDTQKKNQRQPVIFVLDSPEPNQLNCSNVFKRVAAMHCYRCPSLNGSISGCCHIGFLLLTLAAPWFLNVNYNKAVKLVSIKNKYACKFQHPQEAVQTKSNRNVTDLFKCNKKISVNKRPNCPFQNPSIPYKLVLGSEEDEQEIQPVEDNEASEAEVHNESAVVPESSFEDSLSHAMFETIGDDESDVIPDVTDSTQSLVSEATTIASKEPSIVSEASTEATEAPTVASEAPSVASTAASIGSSQRRPIREYWTQKNAADTLSQASGTSKESSMYGHTGADRTKAMKRMREMDPNFPVLNTVSVQSQQGNLLFKCFYLSFKIRYW